MSISKLAALAAMTSLALVPEVAEASSGCWYPNEARAAQLRDLQTKLMVGTLHCRISTPPVVDHYNEFVSAKRHLLEANNQILRVRFTREDGGELGDGQASYDRYHTESANYFSASSSDLGSADCRRILSLARMAAHMSDEDLLTLADSVVEAPSSGACRPSNFSFADEPAPRIAPMPRAEQPGAGAALSAPGAPVPEAFGSAPPVAFARATEVMAAPSLETKLEKVTAVMEVNPAPPAVSSADALKAAVVALQAATAALQAVAASAPDAGATR